MSNDYVIVKRGPLVSCLSCPLCKNLLKEPTTICVCLHTFCRHCINQKFKDDVSNSCPVCKIYLGSFPEELIRPDRTLWEIVEQIFPLGNSTTTEEMPEALPVDDDSTQKNNTDIKANAMSQIVVSQETLVRVHDEGIPAKKKYYLNLNEIPQESSSDPDIALMKTILCEKVLPQVAPTIPDAIIHVDSVAETHQITHQTQLACHKYGENIKNRTYKPAPTFPALNEIDKRIKKKRSMRKRSSFPWSGRVSSDGNTQLSKLMPNWGSDCVVRSVDSGKQYDKGSSTGDVCDEMSNAVWFCLLASEDRTGNALPQIPKPYIRTESGDRAVAHVNRYLARKLNLKHESEVEVMCYGEPLFPNLTLNDVLELWVRATSDYATPSIFFNSGHGNPDGKKYVMELTYRRNEHKPDQM